jgi:hypothetical protein
MHQPHPRGGLLPAPRVDPHHQVADVRRDRLGRRRLPGADRRRQPDAFELVGEPQPDRDDEPATGRRRPGRHLDARAIRHVAVDRAAQPLVGTEHDQHLAGGDRPEGAPGASSSGCWRSTACKPSSIVRT